MNFKMLKGTIFVGYQKRNFLLQNVCAKLTAVAIFIPVKIDIDAANDAEIMIHRRSSIIAVSII